MRVRRRGQEPKRAEAPAWTGPASGRVRVLVEHPDPAAQRVLADGLRERGYDVLTCGGPRAEGRTEVSCPVLRQERCAGVDGADVVVSALSLASPVERRIVRRVARTPGVGRVLVQGRGVDVEQHLAGVHVDGMIAPLSLEGVAAALEELEIPAQR